MSSYLIYRFLILKIKSNFRFRFLILSFFCIIFSISSISWFNFWIWLEINLISFIAYLINNKNKLTIESSIIYFLIQTIASILLLFSIIIILFINKFYYLIIISILIKLGRSPFHYWIPLIIEGLNWIKIFFLLTIQKINPLIILFYNNIFKFLTIFIILSLITGSITRLNYSSLKKIISFSSINQLGWIISSIIFIKFIKIYLIIYFFIIWSIIKSFKLINLKFINQIYNINLKNKYFKLFIFINLISLGGLPPFLGFLPKLILIIKINNSILIFLIILFSLIILFIYIRLIYSILILNSMKINKIFKLNNNLNRYKLIILNLINNLILLILFFIY